MQEDYYEILGLKRNASEADIKRVYRRLARKYHPDLNPGSRTASETFKKIQQAYDILSSSEKRKVYDQLGFYREGFNAADGRHRSGKGSRGFGAFDFGSFQEGKGSGGFAEILSDLFGDYSQPGKARASAVRDLENHIAISFVEAVRGTQVRISVKRSERGSRGGAQKVERLTVKIPAGVNTGSRVRVPGKGNAGAPRKRRGDLYLVIQVRPHKFFERQGDHIICQLPVTVTEAALGAKIEVPIIDGKAVLRIPPGSQSGQKLRLRGRGVPSAKNGRRGDQLVKLKIVLPPIRDERSKEILREFSSLNPYDPRANMGLKDS